MRATSIAALGGLSLAVFGLVVPPASGAVPSIGMAGAAAATAGDDVSVSIATEPELGPGQDLAVTVTLTNAGMTAIEPGSIQVVLDPDRIGTRAGLDAWLDPSAEDPDAGADAVGPSVTVATPRLAAAGNTTLTASIPASSVGLTGSEWGVRGLAASYTSGDSEVAEGRGTVTWYAGEQTTITPVAVAMTITAPVGTAGLLNADELAQLTRPGGLLTRQLDGVVGREVAVGIDPMVIASIRLLGTSAPESAVSWLEQLAGIDNETFPLAWADADVSAQAQAGVTELLGPTSLDYAIDPANFSGETVAPTPTPTTAAETEAPDARPSSTGSGVRSTDAATPGPSDSPDSPTVSPTDAMPTTLPSLADLLAWPYTATNVAWPAAGSVAASDPAVFSANGLTTTIVSSSELTDAGTATPRASAVAGDARVALADDRLSTALSAAVGAVTDLEWRTAMDEVAATLAVASAEGTPEATVLAALDRGWPPTSTRLPATLDAVAQLAWAAPAPLLSSPGAATSVTIGDDGEPAARIAAIPPLLDDETQLAAFSTALTDPALLTGRERSEILGLLAVGWIPQPETWTDAVSEHRVASVATLNSVSVSPSSEVLVVGSPTFIPVSIRNDFTSEVNVHVEATPSNGRLVVDRGVDVTVAAGSSASVKIPVSAQVGSGKVSLTIAMTSATGVAIGQPYTVVANVQADWESLGAAVLGTLVVLFFGFGVVRTIRRRRRERAAAETDAAGTAASTAGEPDDAVTPPLAEPGELEPDDAVTSDPGSGEADDEGTAEGGDGNPGDPEEPRG